MRPLIDAYFAAVYRVRFTPARDIAFSRSPLAGLAAPTPFPDPWCIITAHNPDSRRLGDAENEARDLAMLNRLRAFGCEPVRTIASDRSGAWPEPGWLVTRTNRDLALSLARAFGQRAVVYGHGGKTGLLIAATDQWLVRPLMLTDRGC
ncbi:MAG: DUF3293 domain-containing protein [Phycisphaerales bacterium]|nr:DUF3293 domain-containing protein [Phycisphaerales bacterium]